MEWLAVMLMAWEGMEMIAREKAQACRRSKDAGRAHSRLVFAMGPEGSSACITAKSCIEHGCCRLESD